MPNFIETCQAVLEMNKADDRNNLPLCVHFIYLKKRTHKHDGYYYSELEQLSQ